MADLVPSIRYSTRKASPSTSSPVASPTMADPISTPKRSTRNFTTAVSNPAFAERRDSAVQFERDSLAAVSSFKSNSFLPRLITPDHQTFVASQHSSRPSVSSVNSTSTTGSSIQIDTFSDFRDSTQFSDSNPTSPEEDTSPVAICGAKISSLNIDSDCGVSVGEESPLVERERRKKLLTKSQPGPSPLVLSSQTSFNHQSDLNGTQYPNSALDDTSPTELKSPSVWLGDSFKRLSLNETSVSVPLHRMRSASLRPSEIFKSDQRARATSAPGRAGERAENGADSAITSKGQDEPSETQTKLSSTNAVLPQATKRNYRPGLRGELQTKRTRPQENVEKLAVGTGAQRDSSEPTISSSSGARRTSTTAALSSQSGKAEVKVNATRKKSVNRRKSSSSHKKPSKIPQDNLESEPEHEVQAIHRTDVSPTIPLKTKRQSLPRREKSIEHSDAGDQDIDESDTSSDPGDKDDLQSEQDFASEIEVESTINEEPIHKTFRSFNEDILLEGYIQEALISKIRRPWVTKPMSETEASKSKIEASEFKLELITQKNAVKKPTWTKWGNIYVYSLEPFRRESGIESKPTYQYLKVGFCGERDPIKRINQQQRCYKEKVIPVEDDGIRRFQFAKLVESLIQIEFWNYRLEHPCRGMHSTGRKRKGGPRYHNEWFRVDQQRLLESIEKWRGWITENNPYHPEEYYLQPRWEWKINRISCKWRKLTLDDALQPFTTWEDVEYRWHWICTRRDDLYTQVKVVARVLSRSVRLFVIFGASLYLISTLGLTFVWSCFVLAISVLMYIASGVDY